MCVCPPQSTKQAGAHRADCLAAKEVAVPVVRLNPSLRPPSGAPQMPRYSKRSCVHKSLPVETGRVEGDVTSTGLTLFFKLSCRSAPFAADSLSLLLITPQTALITMKKHTKKGRVQRGTV